MHLLNFFISLFSANLKWSPLAAWPLMQKRCCSVRRVATFTCSMCRPSPWRTKLSTRMSSCRSKSLTIFMINSLASGKCIEGLVQDCSNSSALAMELLQSSTTPSVCGGTLIPILVIDSSSTSCEITLGWIIQDPIEEKSTTGWCYQATSHQATNHHLNQCWPTSSIAT